MAVSDLRSAELEKAQAANAIKDELSKQSEQLESALLERSFEGTKLTSEQIELKRLELSRKQHERRMQEYIRQRKEEAAIKGETYSPGSDLGLLQLQTEGQKIDLEIESATAKAKTKDKPFKDLNTWVNDQLVSAFGIDADAAAAIEAQFSKVFADIVQGWQKATAEQIEANDALQESLTKRSETVQQQLQNEIEIAKLGYANNVEAKQKELNDIGAAQKKAQEEGLRLKKKQATQEIILSELQAGVSLAEAIAKTFTVYSGIPFVGVALAAVQVAAMVALFLGYRSKMKSISAGALHEGGRPIDYLLPGESPRRDAPGQGRGHQIEGTGLRMGAYEMIINEKSTNANLPFFKAVNAGNFDGVDLMAAVNGRKLLPSLKLVYDEISNISDNKSAEKQSQMITVAVEAAMEKHLAGMKRYFDNRTERISHNGVILEYTRDTTKIIRLHD